MAAIFYTPTQGQSIFKNGMQINTSICVPFLDNLVGSNGFAVVTDIMIQNRETIQYFITFDDFISYFYFGKGLGSLTISGAMYSDSSGYFKGANLYNTMIAGMRGYKQVISFGTVVFVGVLSNFTIKASSDGAESNVINFTLDLDIINHSYTPPVFKASC